MTNPTGGNFKITSLPARRIASLNVFARPRWSEAPSKRNKLTESQLRFIARPDDRQDLPLPINFAHLPVLDARIRNLVVDDEIVIECHQP